MNAGLALVRSGQLLYTDDVGKDACGIGGVASKDGKPAAEVVRRALTALKALEHRGGICGDAGDGAGLTCQIPQAFLKEEAKRLRFLHIPCKGLLNNCMLACFRRLNRPLGM